MKWFCAAMSLIVAVIFAYEFWRGLTKGCLHCRTQVINRHETPLLFCTMMIICFAGVFASLAVAYIMMC